MLVFSSITNKEITEIPLRFIRQRRTLMARSLVNDETMLVLFSLEFGFPCRTPFFIKKASVHKG